jgi:hypothetical protein
MPKVVAKNFRNKRFFTYYGKNRLLTLITMIYFRILLFFKYNFVKKSNIYGQDHLPYACLFLTYKKFILIEDGTRTYIPLEQIKNTSKIKELTRKLLSGVTINEILSRKYISKVLLTNLAPIPNYLSQKSEIIDLQQLFSRSDKNIFYKYLSIETDIINSLKNKRILLLTQNFSEQCLITEDEKIEVYKKIIKKYDRDEIIIKPHPSEKTDYNRYLNLPVIPSHIPIQLLYYLSFNPEIVVTINSTGALSMQNKARIDWYGYNAIPSLRDKMPPDVVSPNISID